MAQSHTTITMLVLVIIAAFITLSALASSTTVSVASNTVPTLLATSNAKFGTVLITDKTSTDDIIGTVITELEVDPEVDTPYVIVTSASDHTFDITFTFDPLIVKEYTDVDVTEIDIEVVLGYYPQIDFDQPQQSINDENDEQNNDDSNLETEQSNNNIQDTDQIPPEYFSTQFHIIEKLPKYTISTTSPTNTIVIGKTAELQFPQNGIRKAIIRFQYLHPTTSALIITDSVPFMISPQCILIPTDTTSDFYNLSNWQTSVCNPLGIKRHTKYDPKQDTIVGCSFLTGDCSCKYNYLGATCATEVDICNDVCKSPGTDMVRCPSETTTADAFRNKLGCICKVNYHGDDCSVHVPVCQLDYERCNAHGFPVRDPSTGLCTDICICASEFFEGSRCETCNLTCENGGEARKQCDKCLCHAGFTSTHCQCRQVTTSLVLLADNDVVNAYHTWTETPKNEQLQAEYAKMVALITSASDTGLGFTGLSVSLSTIDPANFTLTTTLEQLTQYSLLEITEPIESPRYTIFNYTMTYGCEGKNPDLDDEKVKIAWDEFDNVLTQHPTIQQLFRFDTSAEKNVVQYELVDIPGTMAAFGQIGVVIAITIALFAIIFV